MIEELLWVVRLVRMIFSAEKERVQITSDLHPFFFSGERGKCTIPLYLVVLQMSI